MNIIGPIVGTINKCGLVRVCVGLLEAVCQCGAKLWGGHVQEPNVEY